MRIEGWGFGVQVLRSRVQGSGFRVQGSGFRVQGSGSRVSGFGTPSRSPTEGCRSELCPWPTPAARPSRPGLAYFFRVWSVGFEMQGSGD